MINRDSVVYINDHEVDINNISHISEYGDRTEFKIGFKNKGDLIIKDPEGKFIVFLIDSMKARSKKSWYKFVLCLINDIHYKIYGY